MLRTPKSKKLNVLSEKTGDAESPGNNKVTKFSTHEKYVLIYFYLYILILLYLLQKL